MDIDVHIKGVLKSSMIDYPGKLSCVVFLNKCNFRCPYCHNPDLVLPEHNAQFPDISVEEFMTFLEQKKKWLDGVVLLGGEPTMHKGLLEFMKRIKDQNLLIKLDTNGSNPSMIQEAIDKGLVDYITMDIKNSPDKYAETINFHVDMDNIDKSIKIIIEAGSNGSIDYDFRTTVLPRFHTESDMAKIASLIKGAKHYYIQQFKIEHPLVNDAFKDERTFSERELEKFKHIMQDSISEVQVRL